jgi:shikimate dehydrogenase
MNRPYAEVIGDPISHSKSPLIHNFWLAKLGIDAEYRACHVRAEQLADYFAQRREDGAWRGCNVTMPHKLVAMSVPDRISAAASLVGALNCVSVENGLLVGENTDVLGVAEPLMRDENSIGDYQNHVATYVQIIGAGGAARAALAAVGRMFDVEFYNRDVVKAKQMAELCGLPDAYGQPLEALGPIRNEGDGSEDQRYSMIVLNASAMGMAGNPPVPINLSTYYPDTIVFDMVYQPIETPLLAQARALGLRTIDGLQMLVGQAAAAFELFFGQPAPREHDAELRALLTS